MKVKDFLDLPNVEFKSHWSDTDVIDGLTGGDVDAYSINWREAQNDVRIQIECKGYKDFDSIRSMGFYVVTFDGKAVGIYKAAGRGETDYTDRYILDLNRYEAMIAYIRTMYVYLNDCVVESVEQDIEGLEYLYGYTLDPTEEGNLKYQS